MITARNRALEGGPIKSVGLKQSRYLIHFIRLAVASVLVVSGIIHISGPYFFLESLLAYDLVLQQLSSTVAIFTMHLVLVVGISIAASLFRPGVYVVASLMFLSFVGAQVVALVFGKTISCGCFGPSSESIGWQSIAIPISLLLATVYLYRFDRDGCVLPEVRNMKLGA